MNIRKHFEYAPMLDLTAANIGINKWDWVSIDSEDEEKARKEMKNNRFDVLPVMSSDGQVTKFYYTKNWNNYDDLICTAISNANTIYYRMSFDDLIRKFKEEKRHYYFLTNHQEVLGLVSYVNLNCNAVYNYLYQVISDIEKRVSDQLRIYIDDNEAIEVLQKITPPPRKNKILDYYGEAVKKGVETSVFHHFYLQTISIMLENFPNKIPPHHQDLIFFKEKFRSKGSYGELRDKIMHPVKPILSDQKTIFQIDELLTDYPIILEIVNRKVN